MLQRTFDRTRRSLGSVSSAPLRNAAAFTSETALSQRRSETYE